TSPPPRRSRSTSGPAGTDPLATGRVDPLAGSAVATAAGHRVRAPAHGVTDEAGDAPYPAAGRTPARPAGSGGEPLVVVVGVGGGPAGGAVAIGVRVGPDAGGTPRGRVELGAARHPHDVQCRPGERGVLAYLAATVGGEPVDRDVETARLQVEAEPVAVGGVEE